MAELWTGSTAAGIAAPIAVDEPYQVAGIERRTATILELWLRPLAGVLGYLPGE
jgi:hypothetical protein